jgi:hypothetical protein
VLAVCATLGQLDYFAALVFQQHDEQSALRKGRGHNVVLSVSVVRRWAIFAGFAGFAYGTLVVRSGRAYFQSPWTRWRFGRQKGHNAPHEVLGNNR